MKIIVDASKECAKCKETKSLSEYHKDKGGYLGTAYWCKVCACENSRKNHHLRKANNPEYKLAKKNDYIKNRYGLSLEEYESKLRTQRFCEICKLDLISSTDTPHLDHCHDTGKVRGFLCKHCNWGLGDFKDNETFLNSAINYLRKYK
jgi:hypothetical protein